MNLNKENAKDKIEVLFEMKAALEKLRCAWIACEVVFNDGRVDCNDYIIGSEENGTLYPFHLSFDDISVVEWVDGATEKIDADLEKYQANSNLGGFGYGVESV